MSVSSGNVSTIGDLIIGTWCSVFLSGHSRFP